MSNQKPKDKIEKASWMLLNAAKDAVTNNVTLAVRQKQLKIENDELAKLLMVIDASLQEGFQRSHKVFCREVDAALLAAEMPPLAKKKTT